MARAAERGLGVSRSSEPGAGFRAHSRCPRGGALPPRPAGTALQEARALGRGLRSSRDAGPPDESLVPSGILVVRPLLRGTARDVRARRPAARFPRAPAL